MRRWAALECGAIGASLLGPQVLVLVKTLGAGQPHTSRSRIRPAAYMFYWGSTHWGTCIEAWSHWGRPEVSLNVEGRLAPRGGIRWSIQQCNSSQSLE
jgi:hypothetical protein